MVTMTAREFNQSVALAQRHANDSPVIVTRRGQPAYVLMSIDEYRRLGGERSSLPLSERLAPSDGVDLSDFDVERSREVGRPDVEL